MLIAVVAHPVNSGIVPGDVEPRSVDYIYIYVCLYRYIVINIVVGQYDYPSSSVVVVAPYPVDSGVVQLSSREASMSMQMTWQHLKPNLRELYY